MSGVSVIDAIGYGAAGLVLATFYMRSMSRLRWVAIASNAAFIAYAYLAQLAPILVLHLLLLPLNVRRLIEVREAGSRPPGRAAQADEGCDEIAPRRRALFRSWRKVRF
jgi:hypothetical protein